MQAWKVLAKAWRTYLNQGGKVDSAIRDSDGANVQRVPTQHLTDIFQL